MYTCLRTFKFKKSNDLGHFFFHLMAGLCQENVFLEIFIPTKINVFL